MRMEDAVFISQFQRSFRQASFFEEGLRSIKKRKTGRSVFFAKRCIDRPFSAWDFRRSKGLQETEKLGICELSAGNLVLQDSFCYNDNDSWACL